MSHLEHSKIIEELDEIILKIEQDEKYYSQLRDNGKVTDKDKKFMVINDKLVRIKAILDIFSTNLE